MAGIGTKPRDLGKPLAQANFAEQVVPQVAPMPQGGVMPSDVPVEPTAEDVGVLSAEEMAELDAIYGAAPQSESIEGLSDDEIAELDSIYGATSGETQERTFMEDVSQLPMRFKAGFARTDKELKKYLEKSYGAKNVRGEGAELEVKENGKWTQFKEDEWGIGDVADIGREVMEAGVAAVPTLMSAPGGPLAMAGANAAGNMLATQAGDSIAENVIGIERDPERSKMAEMAISGGTGAVFGALGGWIAKKAAARAAQKAIPSQADEMMRGAVQDLTELEQRQMQSGLLKPVGDSKKILLPDEFMPENADQKAIKKALSGEPEYQNFIIERVKMMDEGLNKLFGKAGNLEATKTGKEIVLGMDDVLKAEGKLIGNYRDALAQKAGNKALPANSYKTAIDEVSQTLGFVREGSKLTPPSVDDLLAKQIVSTESEAKGLIHFMQKELSQAYNKNGEYTAKEISSKLAELSQQVSRSFKNKSASYEARGAFLKLKNAIRDDELMAMEGYFQTPDFQKIKGNYASIKEASDTLGNLLKNDDISSQALVKGIFSKGRAGLANLRAAKTVLEANNPQAYKDLVGHYLGDLIERNTDELADRATKTSFLKIGKELEGLGPEMLEETFGKQTPQVLEFFKIANRIDKGDIGFMENPRNFGMIKRGLILFKAGFIGAQFDAGEKLIASLGKGKAMQQFLSEEANQQLLMKGLPKAEQLQMKSMFQKILDAGAKGAKATGRIGKEAIRQERIIDDAQDRSDMSEEISP